VIAVWDADDQPVTCDRPELTLPHPRAHERAFVLRPWIDIQPYGQLPGHGWLTDLLNAPALHDDIMAMEARRDLPLESTV
jgi:2-amino-4-hydroxy-6-hydroxymethyldihydropteridine diphosphokinase